MSTLQLTMGMYGREVRSVKGPFDLKCGQTRGDDFIHNGGWYNRFGEKLGWGDLSPDDLIRIKCNIGEEELFIILCEQASFWHFVTHPGMIGSMSAVEASIEAPGVDYVAKNAKYIIAQGRIYSIPWDEKKEEYGVLYNGLMVYWLTRKEAKRLITSQAEAAHQ